MDGFADWVRGVALGLGAPGLYIVAFLDSSFLSLPEITDLLVVWMVTRDTGRMLLYAAAATLGSITGCLLMYAIGQKGGEALIRKRFKAENVDRAMAAFNRFGVLVVLIPAILPPPAPFKIFVLLAGVAGISRTKFVTAIAIGRGARYLALGILAVKYGETAMTYIEENGATVALAVVGVLVAGLLAYLFWRKARGSKGR
ncbi:MAG TPA: VTT domain-containing protein [Vicinamibacterales bacterium]|nr:VTT domain-containing protein [Vicinamibacterales bacterium]